MQPHSYQRYSILTPCSTTILHEGSSEGWAKIQQGRSSWVSPNATWQVSRKTYCVLRLTSLRPINGSAHWSLHRYLSQYSSEHNQAEQPENNRCKVRADFYHCHTPKLRIATSCYQSLLVRPYTSGRREEAPSQRLESLRRSLHIINNILSQLQLWLR